MKISLEKFETLFRIHPTSSLKDCSSSDYSSSCYEMLCYRSSDIQSFKFEEFDMLDDKEKIEFLNHIVLNSSISECVTWALFQAQKVNIQKLISNKKILLNWSYIIENWWHADHLSSIYNSILSDNKVFYKDLQAMNKFSSLWQRRLSITSLYYYAKQCKNPIDINLAMPLVENLLLDDEYYVQKGVGWTLREMSQINYEKTLHFMKTHIKHIAPAGFSASIEKLNEEDKEELKQLRKRGVSNPHEFEAHEENTIKSHHLKHHEREY